MGMGLATGLGERLIGLGLTLLLLRCLSLSGRAGLRSGPSGSSYFCCGVVVEGVLLGADPVPLPLGAAPLGFVVLGVPD